MKSLGQAFGGAGGASGSKEGDGEKSDVKGAEKKEQEENIQFLALLHLTGDFASEGKAMREGMELALDEASDKGIPAGKKINLVVEDTGYDLKTATTILAKNASDETLRAVFVSTLHETKAIASTLEKAHLPTMVLWDSSKELEDMGDYLFGIGPWTEDAGLRAAKFIHDTFKANKVFIISTNNEWSNLVSKAFFDFNLKQGVDVVGSVAMNPQDRDFLSILARVRNSGAEAVYAPLTSNILAFAKQVASSEMSKPIIMSDVISNQLLEEAPGKFDGYYQTMMADPEGPATEAMKRAYSAKYGRDPGNLMLSALGYDAMKMFIKAIELSGSKREEIKDGLYKIKDYPGASGLTTVSEKGSAPKYLSMFQVTDGKFELKERADAPKAP